MLHGSETWPVRKENEVALQRAEMRMVRWMCNVKVKDRDSSKELREKLGIDYIILILQQNRLQWYGRVLQKEDTDWVKKYMEYEVEGSIIPHFLQAGCPSYRPTNSQSIEGIQHWRNSCVNSNCTTSILRAANLCIKIVLRRENGVVEE